MGFFNFSKPKKNTRDAFFEKMMNSTFPKGDKDINAVSNELLHILNNKISPDVAKGIVLKSVVISRIAEEFSEERLKQHLAGYCLHHFSDNQVKKYYNYLVALTAAMMIHRRTPSEVRREGDGYLW